MKLLQNDLHLLIHSLSKAEKAFIHQYAGADKKKERSYLQLMDEMEKAKDYDEKLFLQKHRKKPFVKNFRFAKFYLYQFILDALHLFHASATDSATVAGLIHRSDILFNKGMMRPSFQLLAKAQKICEQKELFAAAAECYNRQYRIIMKGGFEINKPQLSEEICKKELAATEHLHHYTKINFYKSDLMRLLRKAGNNTAKQRSKIESTTEMLKALKPAADAPSKLHIQWHHAIATAQFSMQKFQQARKHLEALMNVYTLHPSRISDEPFNYLAALNNYAMLLLELKAWKKFEQTFDLFQPFLTELDNGRTPQHVLKAAESAANLKMRYMLTKKHVAASFVEKEIEPFLEKYAMRIAVNQQLNLRFHLACFWFNDLNYERAHHALLPVLHEIPKDLRTDIHLQARLLEALIHFEQMNIQLLPYLLDSLSKKSVENERFHELFLMVKKFVVKHQKHKQQATESLKSEAKLLETKIGNQPYVIENLVLQWARRK